MVLSLADQAQGHFCKRLSVNWHSLLHSVSGFFYNAGRQAVEDMVKQTSWLVVERI